MHALYFRSPKHSSTKQQSDRRKSCTFAHTDELTDATNQAGSSIMTQVLINKRKLMGWELNKFYEMK
ncbi:hypothetical protein L798_10188 [Zootermopsis nevadensis]|uniref:Uncharacterized protein n=1 Tax=Zootermopsis nevadensis TaxID=136037 RepID=A0A067QW21_ZOONE|nr:hypothetical protein L798_10188 [Zootermopsis nevadensis]